MEQNNKKASDRRELIRFLITGVICAAADLLTQSLFLKILAEQSTFVKEFFSVLAGFIVGVILNYILSTFWVFKGKQDRKVTKSVGFIVVFVIFSAIAFGLSYGTYALCSLVSSKAWGQDINAAGKIDNILKFQFWGDVAFWLYALAVVLKTAVGLVWNYFTRKYILYRKKELKTTSDGTSEETSEESVAE